MYRFALRPKWVVSHVVMVGLIVAAVVLGFWQLDRLDQRRDTNDLVRDRLDEPMAEIGTLVSVDDPYRIGDDLRFRLASATGEYDADAEVLVLNRSRNGAPGYWVLTPLLLDDGSAVVVNRGWIPFSSGPGEPRPGTEAPTGPVAVGGMVRRTVEPQGLETADPADGVLDALARPDLARYQQQLAYRIMPVYLQLESQEPPGPDFPIPLDRPELDDGPHLSYAVQWFIFATIGLVGYPLVLRRVARSDRGDGRHSDIPVDYL